MNGRVLPPETATIETRPLDARVTNINQQEGHY
jgi:hypothetical protein